MAHHQQRQSPVQRRAVRRSRDLHEEYEESIALNEEVWETGGVPKESFVSSLALHSPRIENVVAWQGRVQEEFVDDVVDAVAQYLR